MTDLGFGGPPRLDSMSALLVGKRVGRVALEKSRRAPPSLHKRRFLEDLRNLKLDVR